MAPAATTDPELRPLLHLFAPVVRESRQVLHRHGFARPPPLKELHGRVGALLEEPKEQGRQEDERDDQSAEDLLPVHAGSYVRGTRTICRARSP
jgi:hypothetical protein